MGELHFEIILSKIFTRLPSKNVGRLKILSKQYNQELSTENFATMHLIQMSKTENKKLITKQDDPIVVFNTFLGQHGAAFSNVILSPYETTIVDLQIISRLNGLILFLDNNINALILCNLTTKAFKVISNSQSGLSYNDLYDTTGMYMDSTGDIKILHLKRHGGIIHLNVYSRRAEAWRFTPFLNETKYNTTDYAWSNGTFCKDALFFSVSKYWSDFQTIIIVFDVNMETFRKLIIPCDQDSWAPQCHTVKIMDNLHIFLTNEDPEFSVDLWKFDSEFWHKVLSFPHVRQLKFGQDVDVKHVVDAGTWILDADWGQLIEVFMDHLQLDYIYDADTFRGLRGAFFLESLISPSM